MFTVLKTINMEIKTNTFKILCYSRLNWFKNAINFYYMFRIQRNENEKKFVSGSF